MLPTKFVSFVKNKRFHKYIRTAPLKKFIITAFPLLTHPAQKKTTSLVIVEANLMYIYPRTGVYGWSAL